MNEKKLNETVLNHTEELVSLTDKEQLKLITNINNHLKRYMLVLDFSSDDQIFKTLRKTAPEMLVALNDMDRLHDYYNDFKNKLAAHTTLTDAEELIMTLESFTEKSGNYHEAAKALHLHVNTVRYRINKIRKFLELENDLILFHERISVMMRIKQAIDQSSAKPQIQNGVA